MAEGKKRLLLIDGNALVHRAYHAVRPLTVRKTGELVNAVFGFTQMLLKALSDFKPDYLACAFDTATPTFRHEKFEAYKQNRPKTADELVEQFPRVREVVEALGIPMFELERYEADDIIGTLSRQATDHGMETIIVTGDADAMQL
ncbi:MAG: DNA polymerase I, partial [Dehalococcoidia bacterium]|nr:DNA polymerase I [Dehalococcoidia bacterium]